MWVNAGAAANSVTNAMAREMGLQGRVMWFDAEANVWQLSTREGVADMVGKCKEANFNTIIVDVKPLAGLAFYKSKIVPKVVEFEGKPYPKDYDLLQTVIEEGHKAGISVHAAINVFSEGSKIWQGGAAFDHPDWQCIQYVVEKTPDGPKKKKIRTGESADVHNAVFVNPLNPEVRNYELSLIREICENYDIDGIVTDRMRYPNLFSDFSDLTRQAFESSIGKKVENWPEDILERDAESDTEFKQGPLYKDWVKFRAQTIHDFLAETRKTVKEAKPDIQLGIYVGSWYPFYFDVGLNWGSPRHKANYDWWPEGYESTGYADLVDYMCTGCYYGNATRREAVEHGDQEWVSVEAAAEESLNAVEDDTFVYASLYLQEYQEHPERLIDAIKQCLISSQGVMLFDLVHVRKYDWWDLLKKALPAPAKAPHDIPGLLDKVHSIVREKNRE